MNPHWPSGTVRALLDTPLVTAPTRAALKSKLATRPVATPRVFELESFAILLAVCDRLVPQDGPERVDLAGALDTRLADGTRDGWRYDALPPDRQAQRAGLAGVDEANHRLFGRAFVLSPASEQDATLSAVQGGSPPGETWRRLPAARWFEELLGELTEIYFAHPLGQERIGYVGMADAAGWTRIGLDEHDPHEPAPETPHAPA
jgi:hypothetical protein